MSARVRFEGLEELRAALRALPATLAAEGASIMTAQAEAARGEIYAAYPRRSGDLRDTLEVLPPQISAGGVTVILRARAKEARWFELGTQTRQTKLGANRGPMPARPTFFPRYYAHRRAMWDDLADLLRREGLTVSGTP